MPWNFDQGLLRGQVALHYIMRMRQLKKAEKTKSLDFVEPVD